MHDSGARFLMPTSARIAVEFILYAALVVFVLIPFVSVGRLIMTSASELAALTMRNQMDSRFACPATEERPPVWTFPKRRNLDV